MSSDVPLWTPSPERIAASNMQRLIDDCGFYDYYSLHAWSLQHPTAFWSRIWSDLGIIGSMGSVVIESGHSLLDARFFPEASLNIGANLCHFDDSSNINETAIIYTDESGVINSLSWQELRQRVWRCAQGLRRMGVKPGDRVVVWLPLGIEAVVVLLATSCLGAVYSSCSPDFGVNGVVDRFGQIEPVVLFTCEEYHYGGKTFLMRDKITAVQEQLGSLQHTVICGKYWEDWLSEQPSGQFELMLFPFDHPWVILYSSGTTGKPKCIVHKTGGVLLNVAKEHSYHCDIDKNSRVMYYTTTGWMMYNWLVLALARGSSIVLYDGNPFLPHPGHLFQLTSDFNITHLGVSAKFLDAVAKTGLRPGDTYDLSNLQCLLSTGSPLSPERFAWVYDAIKKDLHLASISGGTDLCGCFLLGNPCLPVYAGELQVPGLGMAVAVWNELNEPCLPKVPGELVCTQPFPAQPRGFWGDDDGSRYFHAYFAKFNELGHLPDNSPRVVWAHGDFVSQGEHGGFVIHGRSDATLNPGGVRIGTSEIYQVVEAIDDIAESLVFGQQWQNDVRIILIVRLQNGIELSQALIDTIKANIRAATTARHVPAIVLAVPDLPRTRSGKLVELAVSDAVNGRAPRNTEGVANIEALWAIVEAVRQVSMPS
jgi:acetoacetyl-CoA synthetase